jgi:hypothetical protein
MPQSQCNRSDKDKSICPCWEWNPGHPTHSLFTILTQLYRLRYDKKFKLLCYRHTDEKGERKYSFYSFFTSTLDGGEWSVTLRKLFTPGERTSRYPLYRMGLRACLEKSLPLPGVGSRVSSGSIVSDYGLDDRAIGVRSPAGAEEFSSNLRVQTGSGAHQPPVQWVPGVLSPGVKRGRGVTLTTQPHLVPRS